MKTDHIPQGILNPTTYKEAEGFALELGAVATRAMILSSGEIYSTHFFNNQDEEVLLYCHMLTCITAFSEPRKWAAVTKGHHTTLTRIKFFGYKLFNLRKDGSLGPLFINRRQRLEVGKEYPAEDHPTKGYAHRPGWHILCQPTAPHLNQSPPRVWAKVTYRLGEVHEVPISRGGKWVTAKFMTIEEILE